MRYLIIPAACALALAACSKPTELASDDNAVADPSPSTPASDMAAADAGMDHSGHDMPAMDADMQAADAADDTAMAETPHEHTFHTYPDRTEMVHLPVADGETWSATVSDDTLVAMGAGADETMTDGTVHYVVPFDTKASGNATVTFERRADGGEPTESRTIYFMIH